MRRWLLALIIALQVFAGIFSKMDGIRKQEQNALSGSRTENIYSIAYAQAWTETSAVTAETVRQPEAQAEPMKKLLDAIAEVEKNMHSAF